MQPLNALEPILVMLSPITTLVNEEQLLNAELDIFVAVVKTASVTNSLFIYRLPA